MTVVDRRRIGRLSLEAPRAADVSWARRTIGEAMHVATLPGDGRPGRLFIRRIELPPMTVGSSPRRIVRWLEGHVRQLRLRAVPIESPSAGRVDVVVACSEVGPLVLALERLAAGQQLREWFWPRLHPSLGRGTLSQRARAVWRLLAQHEAAALVLPAVLDQLLEAPEALEVVTAIDVPLGRQLARALGAVAIDERTQRALLDVVVAPSRRCLVEEAARRWGFDLRASWLVTAVVLAARPRWSVPRVLALGAELHLRRPAASSDGEETVPTIGRLATEEASRRALSDSRQDPPEPKPHRPMEAGQAVVAPRPRDDAGRAVGPHSELPASDAAPPDPIDQGPTRTEGSLEAPQDRRDTSDPAVRRWSLTERPRPTAHGGLYFLVRPLRRLGLETYLEAHTALADLDFGARLLIRVADRLSVAPDDPIRMPLESDMPTRAAKPRGAGTTGEDAAPVEKGVALPAAPDWEGLWESPSERPKPLGLDPLDDLMDTWLDAVVAWLAQHELELEQVVTREAAVTCTPTHVDVIFDMEASDLGIRWAALDIDPGWVPWLGRVVSFHYVFGGRLDG